MTMTTVSRDLRRRERDEQEEAPAQESDTGRATQDFATAGQGVVVEVREIKFRAWDGEGVWPLDDFYWFEESGFHDMDDVNEHGIILMQYTGLKDKNGVEIYEGDILEGMFSGMGGEWFDNGVVYWEAPSFKLKWEHKSNYELVDDRMEYMDFSHPKFCGERRREVIGNIYSNPDLLEVAE